LPGLSLALVLVAGCSGEQDANLPAAQGGLSAPQMSTSYPQSRSPASFKVAPMPQTRLLPASAIMSAVRPAGGLRPQSIGPLNWTQLSGYSSRVAVAPDGSIWALSDQPAGSINKNIWHYVNGSWTNISGNGASIAVGPAGTVYVVNGTSGDVYAYNGSGWSDLGGGARSVTTGEDGAVYILSNVNVVNGNSAIWKYANGTWTQQPGSGSLLAHSFDSNTYTVAGVGTIVPDGFFLVNSSGATYYYSPGAGYVQFPGASNGVAAVPGGLFELAYPASATGEGLTYFDYASATSTEEGGVGVSLAAGPGSGGTGTQLDEVSSSDIVYTTPVTSAGPVTFDDYPTFGYDNGRDAFNPNSAALTPASVANLHLVWQAALDGGNDFQTQTQPILATEIKGHAGVLFVGGNSGNVYAYDATSGSLIWTRNLGQLS